MDFTVLTLHVSFPYTNDYKFPPFGLLDAPENTDYDSIREEAEQNANKLKDIFAEYGIEASVSDIHCGPAVTRYDLDSAEDVRIKRIKKLDLEIAVRMGVASVRVEFPVSGNPADPALCIEIPNGTRLPVYARSLLDTDTFREMPDPLPVAIGRDIDGNDVLCDISKMPHLLIAGSFGTGKTVCVNSMLISLLYKASPADVRFVLIDPGAADMDIYDGIPHLLVPVISDTHKAVGALRWAMNEMDKRYSLLKKCGVKDIDDYNIKADSDPSFRRLPRIVIFIAELAGLMMTSPEYIEISIPYLSAKGRPAGIHLIAATQRPTACILTEAIKNNIPNRIAFSVMSKKDSRAILDEKGAEKLIGRGDMLYMPADRTPLRVQGCYISDDEVESVVKFIKENSESDYDYKMADYIGHLTAALFPDSENSADAQEEKLLIEATTTIIEEGQVSTSRLQRRLGVGCERVGRIIDKLEQTGFLSNMFCGPKTHEEIMIPEKIRITVRNWMRYREIIKNIPYTEDLKYTPVAVWHHPENIPVGVIPSGDIKKKIIRIPETTVNKYGKAVPVTAVGYGAFRGNQKVTDIIIPRGVNEIYEDAFADCPALERITIPKAVKRIEQGTFENCTALTDIYYEGSPDEWKEIEIVHQKHEVELGELMEGSPVQVKIAERYIHIPGNEPLFSANIHFFCVL